jgi:hypothetical protein
MVETRHFYRQTPPPSNPKPPEEFSRAAETHEISAERPSKTEW